MKLILNGHNERYTVEQSLMNLLPGELPVYEPITPEDTSWAVITLREEGSCRADVELSWQGKTAKGSDERILIGSEFEQEGQRRHVIARAFFKAACEVTGNTPPWGMLTGVRPDKPVTWALAEGKTPAEARTMLETDYFVTPERSALALETGAAAQRISDALAAEKFRSSGLEKQVFRGIAESYVNQHDVLHFAQDLSPAGVRELADAIADRITGIACVLSGTDEGGYSVCLVSHTTDVRPRGKEMNEALCGRGGGKKEAFQGSL